jgi:hypothetical protein
MSGIRSCNPPTLQSGFFGVSIFWALSLALIWFYAIYVHLYFGDYQANIALRGFSAIDFTNSILHPENFTRDYPGGAWSTGKSLLSWIYPLLSSLGIPAKYSLVGMVGFEIFVVVFGAAHLMRTIFKNSRPLALMVLSALMTLSWIRSSNLALFGNPYFHGQFYGFADGLAFLAISFYLISRYKLSSFVLLTGFTIHPIKTVFGMVFIGSMQARKWLCISEIKVFWPYGLFLVFAGIWAWFWLGFGSNYTRITASDFFLYSPLLNSHWYPQDLGVIGEQHVRYMTPFLSSILVSIAILLRGDLSVDIKRKLLFGLTAILVVSVVGIVIAWLGLSITLIKISLQRASVLGLGIATILLTGQTVRDLYSGNWWYAVLGVCLISLAFFTKSVWPLLFVVIYLIPSIVSRKVREQQPMLWFAGLFLMILIFAYQICLIVFGFQEIRFWVVQIVIFALLIPLNQLIKFSYRKNWLNDETRWLNRFKAGILLLILFVGVSNWGEKNRRLGTKSVNQGNAYKEVQIWASKNTSNTALFMVDPCQAYGWRDFSTRSSFGSIHEWYKTGWLYSSDNVALQEGLRRGRRLGIEINMLIPVDARSFHSDNNRQICNEARKNYYRATGEVIKEIASDYDIHYLVLDKVQAEKYGGIPVWPVSFENQTYVVLVPPHRQDML